MRKLFVVSFFIIFSMLALWTVIWPPAAWSFLFIGPIYLIGFYDIVQPKHSILRNYPVFCHLRYLMEELRTKI
jgi:hypothetical protein